MSTRLVKFSGPDLDSAVEFTHPAVRSDARFVFDKHNMVYAYGDLDRYEARLESAGFTRGGVAIPAPHAHHYHYQFDRAEHELMAYWEWKRFPLVPEHD